MFANVIVINPAMSAGESAIVTTKSVKCVSLKTFLNKLSQFAGKFQNKGTIRQKRTGHCPLAAVARQEGVKGCGGGHYENWLNRPLQSDDIANAADYQGEDWMDPMDRRQHTRLRNALLKALGLQEIKVTPPKESW